MTTYSIYRFRFHGGPIRKARGLSLEEAQKHCKSSTTMKRNRDGSIMWFDGYRKED